MLLPLEHEYLILKKTNYFCKDLRFISSYLIYLFFNLAISSIQLD
jgi:hypothetical protein